MTPPPDLGWFRAMRGEAPLELIKANPFAHALATVIAHRARWHNGYNRHQLKQGEALLGDYENYGMSERNYRTAKKQLVKWGFATFKVTPKGTIGKLIDSRLFSVFEIVPDGRTAKQPTISRRSADDQPTISRRLTKILRSVRSIRRGKVDPRFIVKDHERVKRALKQELESVEPDKDLIRAYREQERELRAKIIVGSSDRKPNPKPKPRVLPAPVAPARTGTTTLPPDEAAKLIERCKAEAGLT